MRVLIVEPNASGHHMALYMRHVLQKLFDEGCNVSLLTTHSACSHPGYQLVRNELKGDLHVYYIQEVRPSSSSATLPLLFDQLRYWLAVQKAFNRAPWTDPPDIVYVPTLDWMAKAVEILGSPFGTIKFTALYMSPKHHRQAMNIGPKGRQDWLYDKLFRSLLTNSKLHRLLVIDEFFYDFCVNKYGQQANIVQYVPDFGELTENQISKKTCRDDLGISRDSIILLVYGSLTMRKGIKQLLEAAADPRISNRLVILLAGKPDQHITDLLKTQLGMDLIKSRKLITRLYFHDHSQEYSVFAASDFTWLGYVGFYGSSGVLYQSIHAGLPIIGMTDGLIGKIIERHSLGITINPNSKESIVNGLTYACAPSNLRLSSSRLFADFVAKHSAFRHAENVFESLKL